MKQCFSRSHDDLKKMLPKMNCYLDTLTMLLETESVREQFILLRGNFTQ